MPQFKARRPLNHEGRRIQKGEVFSVTDAQARNLTEGDPNPAAVPYVEAPAAEERQEEPKGKKKR
ncbi:MAG: hypothetical protein ACE5HB_07470 [Terriglobia bacterium]